MRRREVERVMKSESPEIYQAVLQRFDKIPKEKRRQVYPISLRAWVNQEKSLDAPRRKPQFWGDIQDRIEEFRAMQHDECGPSGRPRARA